MERTPAIMMKEFVNSQKFESTSDVMAAMKEMFGEPVNKVKPFIKKRQNILSIERRVQQTRRGNGYKFNQPVKASKQTTKERT